MRNEDLIPLENRDAWQRALEGVPHSYWHTWTCCAALQRTHGLPTFLYVLEHDGARLVCPLAEREWRGATDVFTPGGFSGFASSGPIADAPLRWRDFARARGYVCGYFAQHPLLPRRGDTGASGTGQRLYYFDLSVDTTALLQRMRPNRRNAINRWRRAGQPAILDRERLTEFLVREHGPFMERVNASRATFYAGETLRAIASDAAVQLVGAEDERGLCAVCVFGSTRWCTEAIFNISVRGGRDLAAPLLWWGVEQSLARGIPLLHLGGGIRPGDGVELAKRRWGVPTAPFEQVKQVYDPDRFGHLCDAAGVAPAPDGDYFPPYRSPLRGLVHTR